MFDLTSPTRLALRALRSRARPLAAPFKLTVAVTGRCNAECVYCRSWRGEGVGAFADELTAQELGRLFASLGRALLWLDLTGGEPFIRPDLLQICEQALAGCPELRMLHLPTNGLDPDRVVAACRAIRSLGRGRLVISVSINGPPEQNDRLRRVGNRRLPEATPPGAAAGRGAFDLACETLARLQGLGVEAYAGLTLSRLNEDLLPQTVQAIARRVPGYRPADLHVNIFHDAGAFYGHTGDLSPRPAALRRVLALKRPDSAFAVGELAYLSLGLTFLRRRADPRLRGDQVSPVPCAALRGSAYVAPDGTLFPCQPWGRALGSLREADLDLPRLWRSAEAAAARDALRRHRCPGCWTPCEAYQAMLARPERILLAAGQALGDHLRRPGRAGARPPER